MSHNGNCSCGCFIEGTLVRMGDNTLKPIEQVQVGDTVYSYSKTTREYSVLPVSQAVVQVAKQTVRVSFEDGTMATCTPEHRFGCKCGAWIRADQLEWRRVASMNDLDSVMTVDVKSMPEGTQRVYDLVVPGNHTYLITEQNIVVHDFTI